MIHIYLDNNASTRVDPLVLESMLPYFTEYYANPSSSLHASGDYAANAVKKAKETIADFLNIISADNIIFTSGATESNNLAIKGVVQSAIKNRKHIITSSFEHESVLAVCRELEHSGVAVTYVKVNKDGFVDVDDIKSSICDDTVLISIMGANNEIGTIQPIAEIAELSRRYGIPFHTDAAQLISSGLLKLDQIKADLVTFSAHKIHGAKGIGGLYINSSSVKIKPQILGGNQQLGFRSGTLNVPGIVGMATAFSLLSKYGHEENIKIANLRDTLLELLRKKHFLIVNGSLENRISSNLNMVFPEVTAIALAAEVPEVLFSSGSACSSANGEVSHVLSAIGVDRELIKCSIRLSLSRFTTMDEIVVAADLISKGIDRILIRRNVH